MNVCKCVTCAKMRKYKYKQITNKAKFRNACGPQQTEIAKRFLLLIAMVVRPHKKFQDIFIFPAKYTIQVHRLWSPTLENLKGVSQWWHTKKFNF